MYSATVLALLLPLLSTLVSSSPLQRHPRQFFLVTTSSESPAPENNSTLLPDVTATSLFDPYHQYSWLLRWISPGYGSLPTFNLTNGILHTDAYALGVGEEEFNSTTVTAGDELSFDPKPMTSGNLALSRGYLLTVNGDSEGWTVCNGELGQQVIVWKGTDSSCVPRFIQAVSTAPY